VENAAIAHLIIINVMAILVVVMANVCHSSVILDNAAPLPHLFISVMVTLAVVTHNVYLNNVLMESVAQHPHHHHLINVMELHVQVILSVLLIIAIIHLYVFLLTLKQMANYAH
jgi:hypothetical protein